VSFAVITGDMLAVVEAQTSRVSLCTIILSQSFASHVDSNSLKNNLDTIRGRKLFYRCPVESNDGTSHVSAWAEGHEGQVLIQVSVSSLRDSYLPSPKSREC